MRFAGNTSNVGDWIQAGKAGAKGAGDAFKVARSSAPDYGGMAETAIKARGMERRAAHEAEAHVAQAGIKAIANVKETAITTKGKLDAQKVKLDAKRKAGMVGMFGAAAGGLFMGMENKAAEKRQAERDAKEDARDTERMQLLTDFYKNKPDRPETTPYVEKERPEGTPRPRRSDLDTDTPTDAKPDAKPDTPQTGTQTPVNGGTGTMSPEFKKIYDLAVKDGRTKFPEIVAAQALHETGHLNPNIDSVYNSSGGTNPFGQTGDRGYGTMTREGDSSGWSKFPDLQTAVSDHITLWHDTKNHAGNYNAFDNINDGLASVIPAYSPNSDPANQKLGYTEGGYSAAVRKILRNNGFNVK